MKKIILFLIILANFAIASDFSITMQGYYGAGTAYFSTVYDSSRWVFAYPTESNYYDTVSGYQSVHTYYQNIDSLALDSTGVHFVKIYVWSGGAYGDSIMGTCMGFGTLSTISSGSESCSLTVNDTTDTPMYNARIEIKTLAQTSLVASDYSDVNGLKIFNLDPTSYYLIIKKQGYDDYTDTLVVTQDSSWTLEMTPYSTGACGVYGYVGDIGAYDYKGVYVTAYLVSDSTYITYNDATIYPAGFRQKVKTDSDGRWDMNMIPNSYYSDTNSYYRIEFADNSGWTSVMDSIYVPAQTTWKASR